jgi:uncharacterized protein YdhG (YjbR/CyaY superfamily)
MISPTRDWRDVFTFYNGVFRNVLHDQCPRRKQTIVANANGIVHGAIHAKKTILSDGYSTANDHVRRDETVVVYFRVVSNVVATPKHDVVSNFSKRLKGVVFKNENVFSQFYISPNESV